MAQILYTVKVFYKDKNKHFSVWRNCNTNGVKKIEQFANVKGFAYAEFYKPKTYNSKPLFSLYFVDVYNITIHCKTNAFKKFGVIHLEDEINVAKAMNAVCLNAFNLRTKKAIETIYM